MVGFCSGGLEQHQLTLARFVFSPLLEGGFSFERGFPLTLVSFFHSGCLCCDLAVAQLCLSRANDDGSMFSESFRSPKLVSVLRGAAVLLIPGCLVDAPFGEVRSCFLKN